MSDSIIRVEGIGKEYRIGGQPQGYQTLRDKMAAGLGRLLRPSRQPAPASSARERFWALRDISFEIGQGEVVGIIGRNGAGKSTLLKVLSRITEPTAGRVVLYGRIGSLLEVGTGFHPELTGRENIYMNGAILGMSRVEINRAFDEIVAFAEIERFVDTPVKHYSSGMYMRLAFSVAAHLEPEILLVDEVLAVGDATFQRKCLGKMKAVSRQGRTVLFVSHNMTAVKSLCSRAIWLQSGRVLRDGSVHPVTSEYLNSGVEHASEIVWPDPKEAFGNEQVRLHRIAVMPRNKSEACITVASAVDVEVWYWNLSVNASLNICIEVYNAEDTCVFISFCAPAIMPKTLLRAVCEIPGGLLNNSTYRFRVLIVRDANTIILVHDGVTMEVQDRERDVPYYGKWAGALRPNLNWSTEVVGEEAIATSLSDR